MAFIHPVRVRYAEVDAQGVVFNAHWLTYFDDAMTRFIEALGYDPRTTFTAGGPFDVMLVRSEVEWRGPAGFDDLVDIAVEPVRLGGASFDVRFTARVGARVACTATTTYVSVVPGEHRSTPLPAEVRERLTAHLAGEHSAGDGTFGP